jgi:hypothetical protein
MGVLVVEGWMGNGWGCLIRAWMDAHIHINVSPLPLRPPPNKQTNKQTNRGHPAYTHPPTPPSPPPMQNRLQQAIHILLSYQNGDGGWATYENNRGYGWYEWLNPSEVRAAAWWNGGVMMEWWGGVGGRVRGCVDWSLEWAIPPLEVKEALNDG